MAKIILFDWGNTIMVDFGLPGPMYMWEKVSWVPGAEQALQMLSGFTCCLATNAGESDSEAVRKGLERVGADRYFSHIFSSKEIGFEKPDPRFFRYILQKLQTSPGNCIMIGDNYATDITGARTVGMKTVLKTADPRERDFPLADVVIHGMNELYDAILAL